MAVAEQDGAVVGFAEKIHAVDVHPDAGCLHLERLRRLPEPAQAVQQPAQGQRGGRLQPQQIAVASEQLAGLLDAAKPLLQLGGEDFPLRRDLDARAVALEQSTAEVLLQRFDVLADGARGEMQLLGGQRERAGAGGAFEGAQGVKRRKGTGHRGVSNNESDSQ